ncbi:hypothetical protein CR513_40282, partial [Mucuna pruriens]
MSAMVEVWVGELTKLREKVLGLKAKQGSQREQEEKETQKKENTTVQRDTTMSEATVFLLTSMKEWAIAEPRCLSVKATENKTTSMSSNMFNHLQFSPRLFGGGLNSCIPPQFLHQWCIFTSSSWKYCIQNKLILPHAVHYFSDTNSLQKLLVPPVVYQGQKQRELIPIKRLSIHTNMLCWYLICFTKHLILHDLFHFPLRQQVLEHPRRFPKLPTIVLVNSTTNASDTFSAFRHGPHCSNHTVAAILGTANNANLPLCETIPFKASVARAFLSTSHSMWPYTITTTTTVTFFAKRLNKFIIIRHVICLRITKSDHGRAFNMFWTKRAIVTILFA